jgi:preprotein translocase subunit Sss1
MALKDTYKEAQENKVKDTSVKMELDDFIEEHKKLVKILRKGDKKELAAEADSQEEELKECLKEHGKDD